MPHACGVKRSACHDTGIITFEARREASLLWSPELASAVCLSAIACATVYYLATHAAEAGRTSSMSALVVAACAAALLAVRSIVAAGTAVVSEVLQVMAEDSVFMHRLRVLSANRTTLVLQVMPGLGISTESRMRCGLKARRMFVEVHELISVFINEGLTTSDIRRAIFLTACCL